MTVTATEAHMKITVEHIDATITSFVDLLEQTPTITIPKASTLEALVLQAWESSALPASQDVRTRIAEIFGLYTLAAHVLAARDHPDFEQLVPHLKMLPLLNPLQGSRTEYSERENAKIFELLIGSVVMKVASHVTLDDPKHSKGDNP